MMHEKDYLDILVRLFGDTKRKLCDQIDVTKNYSDDFISQEAEDIVMNAWETFLEKRGENVKYQKLWSMNEKKDTQAEISYVLKSIITYDICNYSRTKYCKNYIEKKRISLSNIELLKESGEVVGSGRVHLEKIRRYCGNIGLRQSEIDFLMFHVSGSIGGLTYQELLIEWNAKFFDKRPIQMSSYKKKFQRIQGKLSTKRRGFCVSGFLM